MKKAEQNQQEAQTIIRQYISELELRVEFLKKKGINSETIPEIRESYREAVDLVKQYRVSLYVLYDYAAFLYDLHDYNEAIEVARWLLSVYRQEKAPEKDQATLKNLLGNLLSDTHQMEEAEEFYREALDLYRRLAATNPAAFEPNIATTCNNLGKLLSDTHRMEEAEEFFREALDIYRRLATANPAAFEPNLAITCFNLGLFQRDEKHDPAAARSLFREALNLWSKDPYFKQDADTVRQALDCLDHPGFLDRLKNWLR